MYLTGLTLVSILFIVAVSDLCSSRSAAILTEKPSMSIEG